MTSNVEEIVFVTWKEGGSEEETMLEAKADIHHTSASSLPFHLNDDVCFLGFS